MDIFGYVYMIVNTINDKAYIGKTTNIQRRMSRHKSDAINGVNKYLYNGMRKHGIENFIYYILEEAYSESELNDLEIYYIALYDTYKGYGYNMSEGGDGFLSGENHPMYGMKGDKNHNFGRKHTSEWREEHSQRMKGDGNPFYGKSHTEESKKRMSDSKLGRKLSEEHKKKVSENHADISGDKNPMARAVVQLTRDNEFITEYDTSKQGADAVGGDNSPIIKCCKGKQKTAYGYKWMYKEDYYNLKDR
ncbi:homing endonuclease [Bacillus phage PBC2]|uniref:GIY-YIG domain-containing protein n=1 Tax=Bacillus phage PBC2 TaxID=1675029 RepID=A0A218KBZ6_9CAUD|nr:homing endonuclease [Bacillus phage PBC2]AKQ08406.1 hypothetical protein PBC2_091 [Bacillus phage PBC2]